MQILYFIPQAVQNDTYPDEVLKLIFVNNIMQL